MRKSLNEHKIPVPRFFKVDNYDEYIQSVEQFYKSFIVKPADNSGSRGVYFVYDKNDKHLIKEAYEYSKKFSRSGEIVVEDYMEGPEVSVESLSINGKVHVIAITDKLTTGAPNFVEMGHSQPSCLSESVKKKIEEITISAIKSIGIIDGPSHTEIIVTSEGPKIVEIGARLGGDNINTHLVPLSTGIDMVKCSIEIALGINPDINKKFQLGSAIKYFNTKPGLIHSIRGVDEAENIEGIKEITFVKKIGDQAAIINNSADRIGFIIAQSTSSSDAMRICEDAENLIYVDTK